LTRQDKIDSINKIIEFKKESDKITDKVYELFGNGENKVSDMTWELFDMYVDLLSSQLGDERNIISWYIFDNDMGKNCLRLQTKNNQDFIIDTVEKLVDFISLKDS
jgi:hypothetical protein